MLEMIDELRKINNELINKNANDLEELKKQKIISELLKDDNCFFKIGIEVAYAILRDLGISEGELSVKYMDLIDAKHYDCDHE